MIMVVKKRTWSLASFSRSRREAGRLLGVLEKSISCLSFCLKRRLPSREKSLWLRKP